MLGYEIWPDHCVRYGPLFGDDIMSGKHEKHAKHRQAKKEDKEIEGRIRDPVFRSKVNDAATRRGHAEPVFHHRPQSEDNEEESS